jgi:hypothetical protein
MINRIAGQGQEAVTAWRLMIRLEPGLLALVAEASQHSHKRGRRFWRAYECIKARMQTLVGWHARNPLLRSSESYDVAHREMLWALEGRG